MTSVTPFPLNTEPHLFLTWVRRYLEGRLSDTWSVDIDPDNQGITVRKVSHTHEELTRARTAANALAVSEAFRSTQETLLEGFTGHKAKPPVAYEELREQTLNRPRLTLTVEQCKADSIYVTVDCHDSKLEEVFADLLGAISERWPESGIREYDTEPIRSPTSFTRETKATREKQEKITEARTLRAEHPELTQAEIANKLGRTERTIRKYLNEP
jgi:hypothetical protein